MKVREIITLKDTSEADLVDKVNWHLETNMELNPHMVTLYPVTENGRTSYVALVEQDNPDSAWNKP